MATEGGTFRLAAAGDLHCRQEQAGRFRELVRGVNGESEGLVIAGDLTDHGAVEEAKRLAEALAELRVPCAAVLGNHDFEAGAVKELVRIFTEAKVLVLDGDHALFARHLGVAGVKGFGGGFERGMLQAFGEPAVKAFVQEGVSEALKLEAALAQLDQEKRVVLLHYAPIAATCQGESPEIYPFLGSSRLGLACDAFGATAVFHGHAHHGQPEGRTPGGRPVYNVALPVLKRVKGERKFVVVDL